MSRVGSSFPRSTSPLTGPSVPTVSDPPPPGVCPTSTPPMWLAGVQTFEELVNEAVSQGYGGRHGCKVGIKLSLSTSLSITDVIPPLAAAAGPAGHAPTGKIILLGVKRPTWLTGAALIDSFGAFICSGPEARRRPQPTDSSSD